MTSRKPLAAVCGATLFLYATYLTSFGLIRPVLGQAFGLNEITSGQLLPPSFLGFIAGVLIGGTASDRIGRKAVIMIGFALAVAGMILIGVVPTLAGVMGAIFLIGFGFGGSLTTATAFASELFPEKQAMIQGVINSLFGIGAIFSPLITGHLLRNGTDWRVIFLGLAVLNGVAFVALGTLRVPRKTSPQSSPSQKNEREESPLLAKEGVGGGSLRTDLLSPAFVLLCVAQILYAGTEIGFWMWMPSLFADKYPNGAAWAGNLVAIFWLAMTIGRFGFGMVSGRMPLMRLNAILGLLTALGMILTLLMPTPALALVFVFLTGLPLSGVLIINIAETGERFRHAAGTIFSGLVASGGVGGTILPYAVSAVAAGYGWTAGLCLPVIGAFGITAVSLALLRLDKHRTE